jgi:dynein heavy chain 1
VPAGWYTGQSRERLAGLVALVVRALRPDRVIAALETYVMQVLGDRISLHPALDLKEVWERDSTPNAPIMICSEPGHDASSRVDALASELSRPLLSVAMGSAEGIHEAEKSIAIAAKSGAWVLLRNIHLCTEWLTLLEKKLQSMQMHSTFRLFLTCEINPKLSTSLLRMSEVLVGAASTGLKANVQRFFAGVPEARMQQAPAERSRLYMLLAWLNAVVQERLRYAPFGWTKRYEFSETDAACALDVIDQWVNDVAGSRTHVDPEQLPWQALRTMLSQSLYGGRIDNPFDQAILDSFINDLFTPASFNPEFAVVKDYENGIEKPLLSLPDGTSR